MNTGKAFVHLVTISVALVVGSIVAAAEPLSVFVSVEPQVAVVERIGGEFVAVSVLLGDGADPHIFSPTPKQITQLGKSKIYFTIGLPFERRLGEKLVGDVVPAIVPTDAGVRKRAGSCEHSSHAQHQHGPECRPEQTDGDDPHIWLSLPLIRIQARIVAGALARCDSSNANMYNRNLAEFIEETRDLEQRIAQVLKPYQGRSFYVFHPAFTYFAADFGLTEVAVETEGKLPSPKQLAGLIAEMKGANVRTIFVQPQFDQRNAQAITEAINGEVVVLDPLARDLLSNLERTARVLAKSFSQ